MKRIILIVLIALLTFSLFSCATKPDEQDSNSSIKEESEDRRTNEDTNPTESGKEKSNIIPVDEFGTFYGFGEGYAFVTREPYSDLYCINEKGEIQFELPYTFEEQYYSLDYGITEWFINGLVVLELYEETNIVAQHLCKPTGEIIKPEDLGCDEFFFGATNNPSQSNRLFADGYIMAVQGNKMGLLNSNLEWVVPLNEEYYKLIHNFIAEDKENGDSWIHYGQNMLLSSVGYINIITCEQGSIEDVEGTFEHPSDYWVFTSGDGKVSFKSQLHNGWYEALNLDDLLGKHIVGKEWKEINEIIPAFGFEDGIADVLVHIDGKHLFSLINEQGKQILGPIAVVGDSCRYDSKTKIYCISGIEDNGDLKIELFNTDGKLSEHTYDLPDGVVNARADVTNGIIYISARCENDGEVTYIKDLLNLDFSSKVY